MKAYCPDCKFFDKGRITPVCLLIKHRYGAIGKEGYISCEK